MEEKFNPLAVFASAMGISSFAGLASLLRTGEQINKKSVISAMLNSGLLGLCIALMWYVNYQENVYFLVGICILAGLGGNSILDFMLTWLKSRITGNFKEIEHGTDKEHVSDQS